MIFGPGRLANVCLYVFCRAAGVRLPPDAETPPHHHHPTTPTDSRGRMNTGGRKERQGGGPVIHLSLHL